MPRAAHLRDRRASPPSTGRVRARACPFPRYPECASFQATKSQAPTVELSNPSRFRSQWAASSVRRTLPPRGRSRRIPLPRVQQSRRGLAPRAHPTEMAASAHPGRRIGFEHRARRRSRARDVWTRRARWEAKEARACARSRVGCSFGCSKTQSLMLGLEPPPWDPHCSGSGTDPRQREGAWRTWKALQHQPPRAPRSRRVAAAD